MRAGQSRRQRVTDLMFSTQTEPFCLVQDTWSRELHRRVSRCYTAWHPTRLHLSPLIPPPPMSLACRIPLKIINYQRAEMVALASYDEVTPSKTSIVVYCKRVLSWNHPRSEVIYYRPDCMKQRGTAGQGPAGLCIDTHPRTNTCDSLDMPCLVSSPSLVSTRSYNLSVTSSLLLDVSVAE
jgi:hypothetical protein